MGLSGGGSNTRGSRAGNGVAGWRDGVGEVGFDRRTIGGHTSSHEIWGHFGHFGSWGAVIEEISEWRHRIRISSCIWRVGASTYQQPRAQANPIGIF